MIARSFFVLLVFSLLAAASYSLQWDLEVYHWLRQSKLSDYSIWSWLTLFGSIKLQIIISLLLMAAFYMKKQREAMSLVAAVGATLVSTEAVVQVFKFAFGRPRPYMFPDYYNFQWFEWAYDFRGFPSGHTATAVALALMLGQIFPRFRILFILLAAIVGFTRLTLEKHWLADVLLSIGIGVLFAYVFYPKTRKYAARLIAFRSQKQGI